MVGSEVSAMTGRWLCRLTGGHRWTKHEGDQGPYRKCVRCGRVLWSEGDDTRLDPNQIPGGGAFGGGMGGGDDGGGG